MRRLLPILVLVGLFMGSGQPAAAQDYYGWKIGQAQRFVCWYDGHLCRYVGWIEHVRSDSYYGHVTGVGLPTYFRSNPGRQPIKLSQHAMALEPEQLAAVLLHEATHLSDLDTAGLPAVWQWQEWECWTESHAFHNQGLYWIWYWEGIDRIPYRDRFDYDMARIIDQMRRYDGGVNPYEYSPTLYPGCR